MTIAFYPERPAPARQSHGNFLRSCDLLTEQFDLIVAIEERVAALRIEADDDDNRMAGDGFGDTDMDRVRKRIEALERIYAALGNVE